MCNFISLGGVQWIQNYIFLHLSKVHICRLRRNGYFLRILNIFLTHYYESIIIWYCKIVNYLETFDSTGQMLRNWAK